MTRSTYFTITTKISDQMIRERDRYDLGCPEDIVVGVPDAQAFLEGVEGARPDITEDDPEGRDGGRQVSGA